MGVSFGKTKLLGGGFISAQTISFTTTSATVEVPCKGMTSVIAVATAIGTPASDEVLSFDEASLLDTNGYIAVPNTNSITLTRTGASKTSGLTVAVVLYGY